MNNPDLGMGMDIGMSADVNMEMGMNMDMDKNGNYVIALADKTVLKIQGLRIKGLDLGKLEETLTAKLQSVVRIIGVTGQSLHMDVYGVDEERFLKDSNGIIKTISLFEGITATEVTEMAYAEKIVAVDFQAIPHKPAGCAAERWKSAANSGQGAG